MTTDVWSGQLRGLAIYSRELSGDDVSKHYAYFIESKQTELPKSEGAVGFYLFNAQADMLFEDFIDEANVCRRQIDAEKTTQSKSVGVPA